MTRHQMMNDGTDNVGARGKKLLSVSEKTGNAIPQQNAVLRGNPSPGR
jgi:hypothetical protein